MITRLHLGEASFHMFLLVLPLMLGGVIHMYIVSKNSLSYLKNPIHPRWFGLNKTWRGFIVMPLASWPGVVLAQGLERLFNADALWINLQPSIILALALGLGYCLAELPNSYLKRRLGIQEGKTADKGRWVFVILDQADSAFGCLIVYKWLLPMSWTIFWATLVTGTIIHLVLNLVLFELGLRKNRF